MTHDETSAVRAVVDHVRSRMAHDGDSCPFCGEMHEDGSTVPVWCPLDLCEKASVVGSDTRKRVLHAATQIGGIVEPGSVALFWVGEIEEALTVASGGAL